MLSLLFASTYCSRGTSATKNDSVREIEEHGQAADREGDAQQVPDRQRVEPPRDGNRQRAQPPEDSPRRSSCAAGPSAGRSTRRPEARSSRCGSHASAVRTPTWTAEAWRTSTAVSGIAKRADLVAEDRDRLTRPEPAGTCRCRCSGTSGACLRPRPRRVATAPSRPEDAMSPLIAVALISTRGPSPSDGASSTSSSDARLAAHRASVDPDLRPLLDADLDVARGRLHRDAPSRTLRACWSPEAVCTLSDAPPRRRDVAGGRANLCVASDVPDLDVARGRVDRRAPSNPLDVHVAARRVHCASPASWSKRRRPMRCPLAALRTGRGR